MGLAEAEGRVAAVLVGLLLLDDVGLDRRRQVVGLAREVGGGVIVVAFVLEGRVAQIGP